MTTPALIRAAITTVVQTAVPADTARVYEYPAGGVTEFPAVIIGQVGWEPGENDWLTEWTISVTVVVARPGTDDQATITELEALWPIVLQAVRDQIDLDQTLHGACNAAWVTRVRPGQIDIAGVRYPATAIEIRLHG